MRADPREEGTAHTTYRCEGEEATWGGGSVIPLRMTLP